MFFVACTTVFVSLIAITIEDFSQRSIHWWWLPLFALGGGWLGYEQVGGELWSFFIVNLLFICLQLFLLTLVFSIKYRRLINITQTHLGIGDILFFIPICLLFSPINLIVFFVSSLILVLLGALFYQSVVKKLKTIPLAGAMAVVLILFLVVEYSLAWDRYSDYYFAIWLAR